MSVHVFGSGPAVNAVLQHLASRHDLLANVASKAFGGTAGTVNWPTVVCDAVAFDMLVNGADLRKRSRQLQPEADPRISLPPDEETLAVATTWHGGVAPPAGLRILPRARVVVVHAPRCVSAAARLGQSLGGLLDAVACHEHAHHFDGVVDSRPARSAARDEHHAQVRAGRRTAGHPRACRPPAGRLPAIP